MVDRLHETFPEFRNLILVQIAAHCPSQLSLIDVSVLITYAGKVVMVEYIGTKLDKGNHLGSEFFQRLLHAKVQQFR